MKAVICVIFNEDQTQVLLTKRFDFPVWVLPGGGVEPDESIEDGCIREIKEEICCSVDLLEKVGTYAPPNFLSEALTHVYIGKISENPEPSDEVKAVQFYAIGDLPKMIPPTHQVWIEHALLPFEKNFFRQVPAVSFSIFFKYVLKHPFLLLKFLFMRIKKTRLTKSESGLTK